MPSSHRKRNRTFNLYLNDGLSRTLESTPDLAQRFFDYYNAVFAEGVLTEREKVLIALSVAHAASCLCR
ncbi:MAG: hypothetical protein CVU57_24745 [Deltaproteobacteria bacterium HGW-Deltaproteobacteria-15]|jgi:alkylhydroperoxidase/carboxymuconolactone decarboxylase family protein YurZ|nr:MAG: hypothetical protein CVU57_24745 [Deltaproteobacteria bacterium HGW-Deltaproteobacteria-15]